MDVRGQIVKFEWEHRVGFYVDSKHLKKCIEYINQNNIEYLILNEIYGYKLKECDFLNETPDIKKIDIVNRDMDLNGLYHLTELEELYSNVGKSQPFSFSFLLKLKKLNFEYLRGMIDFDHCKELREITIAKADPNFLNEATFQSYANLECLKIVQSKVPDFIFLENNKKLRKLHITHCKSPINFKNVRVLNKSLQLLEIEACKKCENLDDISNLSQLRRLVMIDSAPISGANVIVNLPKIRELLLIGSSYFENGNLEGLKDQFEEFDIDAKKHYKYPSWFGPKSKK